MTAWVFDVDGVLCDTNCVSVEEFRSWFIEWSQGRTYYLVTGGLRENTIAQMGPEIVENAVMTYNCLGNSIWYNGQETLINQFTLTPEEDSWLNSMLVTSKFPLRTGRHINLRTGSMNYSIVGRNATPEQRAEYKLWDAHHQERAAIARDFVTMFPRFEAYLGGDISIDICLKGANKGAAAHAIRQHSQDSIYFFGDRCHPGGIDEPFVKACNFDAGDKVYHVSGYQETWRILKGLK
jgi:phosphomannomutase